MEDPSDVLQQLVIVLDELGIPYMIVGATSMRAYVPGRSTFDIDIVLDLNPPAVRDLKERLGDKWYLDEDTAREETAAGRLFNAIHMGTSWKVDFILLKHDEFSRASFGRRKKEHLGSVACWVQSLEDIVLSKLNWAKKSGSARQIEDVRSLLTSGIEVDSAYVAKWALELGLVDLLEEARNG